MLSQADKKHKALNGHSEDSLGSHQSSKTLRFFGDSDKESLKSSRIASPRLKDSSPTRHLLQVSFKLITVLSSNRHPRVKELTSSNFLHYLKSLCISFLRLIGLQYWLCKPAAIHVLILLYIVVNIS